MALPNRGPFLVTQTVKNLPAGAGNVGLIPGLGRSPEVGHCSLLQNSCLENCLGRGAWWATVHGATKSWTWLSDWAPSVNTVFPLARQKHNWQCFSFLNSHSVIIQPPRKYTLLTFDWLCVLKYFQLYLFLELLMLIVISNSFGSCCYYSQRVT